MKNAPKTQKRVVGTVTGIHRGGTTWFGALLQASGLVDVLHEPFNFNHGLRDVPRWYLDPKSQTDRVFVDTSLAAICDGRARYRRPFLRHAKIRSVAKFFVGSGAEKNYREVMKSEQTEIFLKDPFLLTFTSRLVEQGQRCIVIVRHPGAVLASISRMNWNFDVADLQNRGLISQDLDVSNPARLFGAYWAGLFSDAYAAASGPHGKNVLVITHDRFFSDVDRGLERLADFFDLDAPTEGMRDFAQRTTTGDQVDGTKRRVHQLKRNSAELARAWRDRLDPETRAALDAEAAEMFDALDALTTR